MQGCGGDLDILLGARVPAWAAFAQPAGQATVFAWLIQRVGDKPMSTDFIIKLTVQSHRYI